MTEIRGMSGPTIMKGMQELRGGIARHERDGIRRAGGARRRTAEGNPGLLRELEALMESSTGGDPMSELKWTSRSTGRFAEELGHLGQKVSDDTLCCFAVRIGLLLWG